MICPVCGYAMAPFETVCPRCARLKAIKRTRRLPDLRTMVTQRLVKLEQCPACKFMLFPGDKFCASCGTRVTVQSQIRNPATAKPWRRKRGNHDRTMFVVGVVSFVVTLIIVVLFFYAIYRK